MVNIIMKISEVLKQQQQKDPMSGAISTSYTVMSSNGAAKLQVNQEQAGTIAYFFTSGMDFMRGDGKVKFGAGPVEEAEFWQEGSRPNIANFGTTSNLGARILKYTGELKFQMPILGKGPVVFTFTI